MKLPGYAAFVGEQDGSHVKPGPYCRNFQSPDSVVFRKGRIAK